VNPDERWDCAANQAGQLKGEVGEVLLPDVTPLTLGIETSVGCHATHPKNTTIPTEKSQISACH
jgi:molecular chaperone DnaK